MWRIKDTILLVISLLISLMLLGSALAIPHFAQVSQQKVSSTVIAFGQKLQQVSVFAPTSSTTIATVYGPYVTGSLLASWEANIPSTPGRTVSSPWPDHIVIQQITPTSRGYMVYGNIVLMTSNEVIHGGNAGVIPVVIQLVPENHAWKISSFQEYSSK